MVKKKKINKAKPKTKSKVRGRPRIVIDWQRVRKYCELQCTLVEIASLFDCSEDTIENAVKREYKCLFSELYKRWSATGKKSLRRKQYEIAMNGNVTMLIWLGKQYLGQKEHAIVETEPELYETPESMRSA